MELNSDENLDENAVVNTGPLFVVLQEKNGPWGGPCNELRDDFRNGVEKHTSTHFESSLFEDQNSGRSPSKTT